MKLEHKIYNSLKQYGINNTVVVFHNPSYEQLRADELDSKLEGFEKGYMTELDAVNVMTGVFTGRSPKDKYIIKDDVTEDTIWWNNSQSPNDNKPLPIEV